MSTTEESEFNPWSGAPGFEPGASRSQTETDRLRWQEAVELVMSDGANNAVDAYRTLTAYQPSTSEDGP